MNNLEKLLQDCSEKGGVSEALLYVMNNDVCDRCPARFFCELEEGKAINGCAELRARWLLQEYVETDSWEKIEADAKKSMNEYWKCEGISCINCPAVFDRFIKPYEYYDTDGFSVFDMCANAQKCDIVARCKKLAGVEE